MPRTRSGLRLDRFGTPRVRLGPAVHLQGMTTQLRTVAGLDPLLSMEDLAEYLGFPIATIYDWRVDGKGPRGIRVGRHVKFTTAHLPPHGQSGAVSWAPDVGLCLMASRLLAWAPRVRLTCGVAELARVAGVSMALALVASCASGGPDASPASSRTPIDGSGAVLSSPDPARAEEAGSYTPFVFEPEFPGQLTPLEAKECRDEVVAAGHDPAADWVLVLTRGRSGADLTVALRDDFAVRVGCRVSQAVLTRPVTRHIRSDDAGIRQQCGSVAGYDFTGWSVVTSMTAASGVEAVLASTNGYTAYCSLQPDGWDSGSDQMVTMPTLSDVQVGRRRQVEGYGFPGEGTFAGASLSLKTASTPIEGQLWWGSGSLYEPGGRLTSDADRITLSFTGVGNEFVIPVVRGRWAARIHLADQTGPLGGYRAVIQDGSGRVLAQHVSSP